MPNRCMKEGNAFSVVGPTQWSTLPLTIFERTNFNVGRDLCKHYCGTLWTDKPERSSLRIHEKSKHVSILVT